jgi:hypothetical protein
VVRKRDLSPSRETLFSGLTMLRLGVPMAAVKTPGRQAKPPIRGRTPELLSD